MTPSKAYKHVEMEARYEYNENDRAKCVAYLLCLKKEQGYLNAEEVAPKKLRKLFGYDKEKDENMRIIDVMNRILHEGYIAGIYYSEQWKSAFKYIVPDRMKKLNVAECTPHSFLVTGVVDNTSRGGDVHRLRIDAYGKKGQPLDDEVKARYYVDGKRVPFWKFEEVVHFERD